MQIGAVEMRVITAPLHFIRCSMKNINNINFRFGDDGSRETHFCSSDRSTQTNYAYESRPVRIRRLFLDDLDYS